VDSSLTNNRLRKRSRDRPHISIIGVYFWKCQKRRGEPNGTEILARMVGATLTFKRRCLPDDLNENEGSRDAMVVCRSGG
jgi:hypothetical protein